MFRYTRTVVKGGQRLFASRATGIKVNFPGALESRYTEDLKFQEFHPIMPTYRVLDTNGNVVVASEDPKLEKEQCVRMLETMLRLNAMDLVLYEAQRQGRISFYMTNYGEEATHIGSAAALNNGDVIYGQYREAGVLMWRGFSLSQFMNQCYANELDVGKGRQMPVHYGSKELNFQTISSPLGTQIPQAAGSGYALKQAGQPNCAVCYFGEGAASEGDFHAALNMASTTGAQTIFFCRNNGYAISTPAKDQYRGDGIATRGPAYGINTIRVDGNDVLAVYNATLRAREICVKESKPVLIEALTYRVGHHSTSDDSSAYRSKREVEDWKRHDSPVARFRQYLEKKGWWSAEKDAAVRKQVRSEVLRAFSDAEKLPKPAVAELFEDVYDVLPWHLKEQKADLAKVIEKYKDQGFFPISDHASKDL